MYFCKKKKILRWPSFEKQSLVVYSSKSSTYDRPCENKEAVAIPKQFNQRIEWISELCWCLADGI